MRILIIFLLLAVVFLIPFLIWGERFETWLSGEEAIRWLRSYGAWAGIMAMLLLVSDLVLPVPATGVMAGLGVLYGPLWGGLIGGLGSVLSGLAAYGICRSLGRRPALWLTGEQDLARGEAFFARTGAWAVVISRWMPLLPEVIACMAGLMKMPFCRFLLALVCGSLPMAMAYAGLGHAAESRPLLAILISAALPIVLWFWIRRFFMHKEKEERK